MNKLVSSVKITSNALTKLNKISSINQEKSKFLFSVSSGGCNGFNYKLNLIDNKQFKTIISENKHPTTVIDDKVIVDPFSEMYLLGTTIDYIAEDYSKGIFESKFIFTPDKDIATSCGCGVSFSPK